MGLHYVQHRQIDQRFAVDITLNIPLAGQLAHHRYHGLGEGLALFPVGEVIVGSLPLSLLDHCECCPTSLLSSELGV